MLASQGMRPFAISIQNSRSTSRGSGGCPRDLILGRSARSAACCRRTTEHLHCHGVLRQPVEFTVNAPIAVMNQTREVVTPREDRHLECVDGYVTAQGVRH